MCVGQSRSEKSYSSRRVPPGTTGRPTSTPEVNQPTRCQKSNPQISPPDRSLCVPTEKSCQSARKTVAEPGIEQELSRTLLCSLYDRQVIPNPARAHQ